MRSSWRCTPVRGATSYRTPGDGLSALMLADAGFEATATSSVALAATLGRVSGHHNITRDEHLGHARLIGRLTGLPVNGNFEDGYGDTPDDVAATVERAVECGVAGDGSISTTPFGA
jgi:2-methylisocitrate lyase-like PEP mutase family enzyme